MSGLDYEALRQFDVDLAGALEAYPAERRVLQERLTEFARRETESDRGSLEAVVIREAGQFADKLAQKLEGR